MRGVLCFEMDGIWNAYFFLSCHRFASKFKAAITLRAAINQNRVFPGSKIIPPKKTAIPRSIMAAPVTRSKFFFVIRFYRGTSLDIG